MLSVEEAAARIIADVHPLATERLPLLEALGRVLASDVVSPVSLPPWDNASMDGYAVRAADVATATPTAPVVLPVLETVGAGQRATRRLEPRSAIRIMTGAPIPDGADTVIRVEDTDHGSSTVQIRDARDAGRNLRPAGEDIRRGTVAMSSGTLLAPAHLGVLASVGAAGVDVYRAPRVAVLSTGDELVDVDGFEAVLRGDRIVSSNSYTLRAAVVAAGGRVVDLGIAPDDRAALQNRLASAPPYDLLLTTGGISVGAFDFTRDVLTALGAALGFWRVRMRPGAPIGFGLLHGTPWIGLPGNPVSTMVTFELFAAPAIRKLRGERLLFRQPVSVVADEPVAIAAPLTHFLRGVVHLGDDGRYHARLTGPQGSGLLTSMARANALLIVPDDRPQIEAGEQLLALPLGDTVYRAAELRLR